MSADRKIRCHRTPYPVEVLYRLLLCGHRCYERHVEILLPAGQRLIRAPESNIRKTVVKHAGDGRKLYLPLWIHNVHMIVEPYGRESPASRHCLEQFAVYLLKSAVGIKRLIIPALLKFPYTHSLFYPSAPGKDLIELKIGKLGKHKGIHLIKRFFLYRISSVSDNIVGYITHSYSFDQNRRNPLSRLPKGFPKKRSYSLFYR